MSIRFVAAISRRTHVVQAVGVRAAYALDLLPCHASAIRCIKRIGRPSAAYLWRS